MTTLSDESLWAKLVSRGIVQGEEPRPSEHGSPWYVRLMLGISGWIGALFLLGFVGAIFAIVLEHSFVAITVGALVCAGAGFVFRSSSTSDFVGQFGLALSIAGQALIAFGLARWFDPALWPAALLMAAVQSALFMLIANFVHRVWVAWTGVFAAALALGDVGLHAFALALATAAFAWIWVREFDFAAKAETVRAGGYGLTLACIQLALMHGDNWWSSVLREGAVRQSGSVVAWLGVGLSAAVVIWAAVLLLRREGVSLNSAMGRIALAGAAIVCLLSMKAPGIGTAVAILVVGFANGNRLLAGLGVVSLLAYLSQYYYTLHATLLEKSIVLICTGIALLVTRLVLHHWWPLRATEIPRA